MGLFDRFKKHTDKAKDLMESQGDKIAEGVDKGTDFVDDKTGGKYADHLDKVDDMADKLGDDESDGESADET